MEKIKRNILEFFKDLEFNSEEHRYSINGSDIKISVSGIVKKFSEPFNRYEISKRVAKKRGISQEEVLQEWDSKKDTACSLGTDVHLFGELYPFNRHLEPRNGYEEAIVKFWNDLPENVIPLIMELQMYHKDYLYAGTADIILYNTITKTFIIGDYKTNEDLFKNFKGKKMLSPFKDLYDCPYSKYELQLSLYQILFEQIGLKVSSRKLIWLKPDGQYILYNTRDLTNILTEYLNSNKI